MLNMDDSPRQRVRDAVDLRRPARLPRDFAAVPELWNQLADRLGVKDRQGILERLGSDCRVVSYDSFCKHPDYPQADSHLTRERSGTGGMWRAVLPNGDHVDIWGARRRRIAHDYGSYDDLVDHPLATAESPSDIARHRWPQPTWWDFVRLRESIAELNRSATYHIRWRIGSVFETAWSLTGLEKFQIDLATQPALCRSIMDRICAVHEENLRRVLTLAGDLIDMAYFYDDVAMQTGPLMSPAMYMEHIAPYHRRLIELAASFGKPTMIHCCGAVRDLIGHWIDMGVRVLNPIQTSARGMDIAGLAHEFGRHLCFHGGMDVQSFLPYATPRQVRDQVRKLHDVLGAGGGYILAGTHHLQADTPLDNVLAMYDLL